MSPHALMDGLIVRGVRLEIDDDGLVVDAPRGVLTPADRAALTEHKAELVALLTPPAPPEPEPEITWDNLAANPEPMSEHGKRIAALTRELVELAIENGGVWTDPQYADIDWDTDIRDYIFP